MTNWEERVCQLCVAVGGWYYRREKLLSDGHTAQAESLDPHIRLMISDLTQWLLKNEKGDLDE